MSESAPSLCEGIIRSPCSREVLGTELAWTTSANSIFDFGGKREDQPWLWPSSLLKRPSVV